MLDRELAARPRARNAAHAGPRAPAAHDRANQSWCARVADQGACVLPKNPWMHIEYVLAQFGSTRRKALYEYRKFMSEEMSKDQAEKLRGGGLIRSQGGWSQVLSMRRREQKEAFDGRILGGGDFVNKVLDDTEERQVGQVKNKRAGLMIQKIIDEECREKGISSAELKGGSKRRKVSDVRSLIGLRSRDELGLSSAEIARHVGVTTSAISRSIERVERSRYKT